MRVSKAAFCTKCNAERPTFKDYLYAKDGTKKSHYKVTICAVCRERTYPSSKYKNIPTKSKFSDRIFHSKKESRREPALVAMQNAGVICELRYQVPYRLDVYGTQSVEALLVAIEAGSSLRALQTHVIEVRRSLQKIALYKADFVYKDRHGNEVIEDVKGRADRVYAMKKRLMLSCQNIEIVEPSDYGVEQRARGAGVRGAHTGSRFKGCR